MVLTGEAGPQRTVITGKGPSASSDSSSSNFFDDENNGDLLNYKTQSPSEEILK